MATLELSREVLQLAEKHGLGDPKGAAASSGLRSIRGLLISVAVVAGAAILGGILESKAWSGISLAIAGVALLVGLVHMRWFLWSLSLERHTIFLFQAGFIEQTEVGRTVFPWDDIDEVWIDAERQALTGASQYRYRVVRRSGGTLRPAECVLGRELPSIRQFGEIVASEVAVRRINNYLATVSEGKTAWFNRLGISRDGVHHKDGRLLAWGNVKNVRLHEGNVLVTRTGKKISHWSQVEASNIPNISCFLTLVDRMLAGHGHVRD